MTNEEWINYLSEIKKLVGWTNKIYVSDIPCPCQKEINDKKIKNRWVDKRYIKKEKNDDEVKIEEDVIKEYILMKLWDIIMLHDISEGDEIKVTVIKNNKIKDMKIDFKI
jgi:hypothetical protein